MSTQSTLVNQPHSNGEGTPPRLASVGSEGERSEPDVTSSLSSDQANEAAPSAIVTSSYTRHAAVKRS